MWNMEFYNPEGIYYQEQPPSGDNMQFNPNSCMNPCYGNFPNQNCAFPSELRIQDAYHLHVYVPDMIPPLQPAVYNSNSSSATVSGSNLSRPGESGVMLPPQSQPSISNKAQRNPGKTRTSDKYRSVYTERQRTELEKEFSIDKFINPRRTSELSSRVGLSERQIKIWFQNRRVKQRKTETSLVKQNSVEIGIEPLVPPNPDNIQQQIINHQQNVNHYHQNNHQLHQSPPRQSPATEKPILQQRKLNRISSPWALEKFIINIVEKYENRKNT